MVFSTNQFRHLYVATAKGTVSENSAAGTIDVKTDANGTHIYFPYMGKGGQVRSDLIKIDNILHAKATNASSMAKELSSFVITLDSNVNSGKAIVGQTYILKIAYKQFVGMSDEDTYYEYGEAYADSDSASELYKKLAINLAKNTAKQGLVSIKIIDHPDDSDEFTPVTANTKIESLTDTYTGILIDTLEQDWVLGTKPLTFVNITASDIMGVPVTLQGNEVLWATVEETSPSATINNGKTIADLEYFCMGERGDIYRNMGWPNSIPTSYMVNPTQAYHTFDIHYAFVGDNENPQKSEKDITIVCASTDTLNSIITAFNTATSLNVSTL